MFKKLNTDVLDTRGIAWYVIKDVLIEQSA